MSISLPNGTLLAAPSSSSSTVQLSAAVTRILHLANFSSELKTRDLQNLFKEWESDKGGYRIKWLDDVNALVVFADASVAKRAYLSLLLNRPPQFSGLIKPYDRPDAAQIIQSLAARSLGHRSGGSIMNGAGSVGGHGGAHGGGGSISFPFPSNNDPAAPQVHSRAMSVTNPLNKSGSISINPVGAGQSISGAFASNGNNSSGVGVGHVRGSTAPQRIGGGGHHRTGSASASSSWNNRLSGSFGGGGGGNPFLGGVGVGGGALNFASSSVSAAANKLPTHNETSLSASRSTSDSDGEPNVVILDPSATQGLKTRSISASISRNANANTNGRRESVSAEKAMREVEKALASVEAQG
ncbi:uncharacterized protein I303_100404 [Kwoniella dejecticola CBS 10117]|uniref:Thc1 RRM domain-containing protein n=1 Tax=Kwoniella dejecticola CBS 10117 TaxID=1296121 RepID=A0A1A6AEV0_9TREE|nr:uncharacterized protein I303_00403 [Kwoniella dejecticola CBS 10117]OBR88586.1 hypothetical protein I303_00403 [Kwoniella dejecticola CBS 10117]